MVTRAIDLAGLPDDAVKDVEAYVARLKRQYEPETNGQAAAQGRVQFNVQPGTVYGDLTREEIYDDER
jgi:hypothetical protein